MTSPDCFMYRAKLGEMWSRTRAEVDTLHTVTRDLIDMLARKWTPCTLSPGTLSTG